MPVESLVSHFPRPAPRSWPLGPLLALALLSAAGCGDGRLAASGRAVRPVVFWHSMAGDLGKFMRVLVDKFNALHPDTPVEPVYQGGYDLLAQKIRTSVVAGQPPVMAQMYECWTAYLNREKGQEALASLDEEIARPDFLAGDVFPVLLADGTFDGHVLAMPFNKSFPVLYYNKDLFRAAGLDPEKPPRTWSEFAAMGRKLTRDTNADGKPDVWGWSFSVDPWIFLCQVLQNGGTFLSEDGRTAHFDQPPAVEALDFWIDAIKGPGMFAYQSTDFEPQNEFVAGKVAMILTSSVSKTFMKPMVRFDMGMAPIPEGKHKAAIVAGTNVGIFSKAPADLKKAAWQFLQFFTNTENSTYWAVKTNYVPVRRSCVQSKVWNEWLKLDPTAGVAISQMDEASYEPRFPEWTDCRKELAQAMTAALQEGSNAAQHLAAANAAINAKLARRLGTVE